MTDDLPPHVRALLDAERHAPVGTDEARSAIRARIAVTAGTAVGLGATQAAAAGVTAATKSVLSAKVVAMLAVAGLAGGGAVIAHVTSTPAPSPAPAPSIVAPVPSPTPPATPDAAVSPEAPPPPPVERREETPAPRPRRDRTPSVSEAELLGEASHALSRGDARRALAIVDEHARTYPAGALAEERDALRIEALLAEGRHPEARDQAAEFARRYPHSIHQRLIDRVNQEHAP